MKRFGTVIAVGVMIFGILGSTSADLLLRGTDNLGRNLIYDTDLDITWYDYTKTADTWFNQMLWVDTLTVSFGGAIFSDWRLPSTIDGPVVWGYCGDSDGDGVYDYTQGYNLANSEMGHLYYSELGNIGWQDTDGTSPALGWGLRNTGDFQNLRGLTYWSSTELSFVNPPGYEPDHAWFFAFNVGRQDQHFKDRTFYAVAVFDGDIAAPVPIPEPTTILLFAIGIAGIVGTRIRRKNNKM